MKVLQAAAVCALTAGSAYAQTTPVRQPWVLEVDYQHFYVDSNVAQKPNTIDGTRFSITQFTGDTGNGVRLTGFAPLDLWRAGDALRVVIAPLTLSGTGVSATPINFDGATFAANTPLQVNYRFNTYRITYLLPVFSEARESGWDLRLGGTLGIRDAQIKLSQGSLVRDFTNVGPVPLLYFSATKSLGDGWSLLGEFDAFPAPGGGGLFDGSLKIARQLTGSVAMTAGVRYQIGAANDPEIYNALREVMFVLGVRGSF